MSPSRVHHTLIACRESGGLWPPTRVAGECVRLGGGCDTFPCETESRPELIPIQRDLTHARATLQKWMEVRYPGENPEVGVLEGFPQGFSAELLTFDLTHLDDGVRRTEGMVVRIEPNEKYQLFLDTNFEEQYRVMEALGGQTSVPVPRTIGFETDTKLLGARFYVMEKSPGETGQVGLDWVTDIGDAGRDRLWWNGLAAMAEMHRVDPEQLGLGFLDQPTRGSDATDQQLHYYWEYYSWVRGSESFPLIETAYEWLRRNKPWDMPPTGIVWGDARRGNQLFTEDLSCSAILDFEQVCLGPAEVDLAWWLEGEHQTCQWMGISAPSVEETTARYGELLGRDIADIGYYMVFASFRLAVLRIKLSALRQGQPDGAAPDAGIPRLSEVLAKYAGIETRLLQ